MLQAGLALLAMLAFSLSDVLAKLLGPAIPPLEIAWFRYLGAVIVLGPLLLRRPSILRSRAPAIQLLRSVCMVVATALLIAAVQLMPIAQATTLVFVSPIFVALLSILLLKERIGAVRSACILVGLGGVALVAKPDLAAPEPAALLPLCAALCWALAMVLTRVIQARGDGFMTTLAHAALGGFVMASLVLPAVFVMPSAGQSLLAAAMSLCWIGAQVAVLAAYRIGQVANVAPFSYTQIVWSVVLGYLILAERPDALSFAGCAIVIVSGVAAARRSAQEASR